MINTDTNENKNTLKIVAIAILIIAVGVLFFLTRGPAARQLTDNQVLPHIELTEEEIQALEDAGFMVPTAGENDDFIKALKTVRSSDEFVAIEVDLNKTDLQRLDKILDAELDAIDDLLDFDLGDQNEVVE